jgi:RNase H-fold protein (predicted Holliday junction resolvase)
VRVVVGAPLHVEENAQPSREQSQQTAQRILDLAEPGPGAIAEVTTDG